MTAVLKPRRARPLEMLRWWLVFTDAALAGRYYDDACHVVPFSIESAQSFWSGGISSMLGVGPLQRTWA